jgi:DNA-binding response OmpR family regulator
MHILLVDDERHVRRALARSLEASGHIVTEAERGVDALALLGRDPVDLLVLDVNLPDMSGWDVLRTAQARRLQSPPVVVISAIPPSVARQQEFHPFGVLHKPFPLESLHRLAGLASTKAKPARMAIDD